MTGDQVRELADQLDLSFEDDPELSVLAAIVVNDYLEASDPHLEPFVLRAVDLWEKPVKDRDGDYEPEVHWMIPTARYRDNRVIDPNSHQNTIKVKKAVMDVEVPESFLNNFDTFPNPKYPYTHICIR